MKKILLFVVLLALILPEASLATPTVKWGYRNITEHSQCSKLSAEESYADISDGCTYPLVEDEGTCIAYGSCRNYDEQFAKQCLRNGSSVWASTNMNLGTTKQPCPYISTQQPKFLFNIETTAEVSQVKFRFVIGTDSDLRNPDNIVMDYESPVYDVVVEGDPSRLWYSKDVSFTIGQVLETGATYHTGSPGDKLGGYGTEPPYYWYIEATEIQGGATDVLTSGDATDVNGNDNKTTCGLAFYVGKYFAANSTRKFYSQEGAITETTALISFISPYDLVYYIETDTTSGFPSPTSHPATEDATNTAEEPEKILITGLQEYTEIFYRLRWKESGDPSFFGRR